MIFNVLAYDYIIICKETNEEFLTINEINYPLDKTDLYHKLYNDESFIYNNLTFNWKKSIIGHSDPGNGNLIKFFSACKKQRINQLNRYRSALRRMK